MRTAAGGALFCTGFALGAVGASLAGHHDQPPAAVSLQLQKAPQHPDAGPYRAIHRPVPTGTRTVVATGPATSEPPLHAGAGSAPPVGTSDPAAPAIAPAQSASTVGPGLGTGKGVEISLRPLGLLAAVADPICNLPPNSPARAVRHAVDPTGIDICGSLRQLAAPASTGSPGTDRAVAGTTARPTAN